MRLLVTGGLGFIGSNCILDLLALDHEILNIDKSQDHFFLDFELKKDLKSQYSFLNVDITDFDLVNQTIKEFKPDAVLHFAAESHVDNSIENPAVFIETNIKGTFNLLESSLKNIDNNNFLFLHVSTDEVFGDLNKNDPPFIENNRYIPNSPYSASKAASDHLVRSYSKTYGLKTVVTNCSNNFGPNQHPEKLIPQAIMRLSNNFKIPVYGSGLQIRDWLYVKDHCTALINILLNFKRSHDTYNIGSRNELTNLAILEKIINFYYEDEVDINDYIEVVEDRKGHDKRYSINPSKIESDFSWKPKHEFDDALAQTVNWYKENTWILERNSNLLSKIHTGKIT